MSASIIGQIEDMRRVNGDALQDLERRVIEFSGLHLAPSLANAFIETVRADLRRLDMRSGLAAIAEELNGQQA